MRQIGLYLMIFGGGLFLFSMLGPELGLTPIVWDDQIAYSGAAAVIGLLLAVLSPKRGPNEGA
jgi:hypothetical protein